MQIARSSPGRGHWTRTRAERRVGGDSGSRTPTCGTQALAQSDPHPELDNQTRKEPQRRLTGLLLLPERQMIPASAA